MPLESHGIVDEGGIVICDITELVGDQYLQSLQFGYTNSDLITLTYRVQVSKAFGE